MSLGGWFKTLRTNGCWRKWDADGIVQAQRKVRGPAAPDGMPPDTVYWCVVRVEPAGCRVQGWGLTRKEAYESLLIKEFGRRKRDARTCMWPNSNRNKVKTCAES